MKKMLILAALLCSVGFVGNAGAATLVTVASGPQAGAPYAGSITINPDNSITFVQVTGEYDGVDDVAYNVINNSANDIGGLVLTGAGIGDFDGDGIDNYADSAGNSKGDYLDGGVGDGSDTSANGYAGYTDGIKNFWSSIQLDITPGVDQVDLQFGNGLAAGDTSFFSLEAETGVPSTLNVTTSAVPLPASVWSGGALLLCLGAYLKFIKPKVA